MKSIFIDKKIIPADAHLKKALGSTYKLWRQLADFTRASYANAAGEWKFSGEKYGWGFRIKDKKRVLIYLLPRDNFFKVGFVFGQKATDEILKSDIAELLKNEIRSAKVYAEGRGIRIEVKDNSLLTDLQKLITIKISN